ncbi:hypothetical protein D3C71_1715340 [compost metagenome]
MVERGALGGGHQTCGDAAIAKGLEHPQRPQCGTAQMPLALEVDANLAGGKTIDLRHQERATAAFLGTERRGEDFPMRRVQAEPFEIRQVGPAGWANCDGQADHILRRGGGVHSSSGLQTN